ncbi:hypothetical protein [uncultured Microbacterium sp.]|jgi:hypothetical protein|uniref:hypothetical protein n=1 Tax=uncultured Microbacterium sp. TaxID=191216 RepID=UPI002609D72D|nr:hypothetical protein [uncultured Microbacterium sp.]
MTEPQFPAPGAQPHGSIPPVPRAPAPPPGAYGVPVGGYQAPVGGYQVPPQAPRRARTTGLIALLSALVAAVVAPVLAGVLGLQIGLQVRLEDIADPATGAVSPAALSPVRTQVLWLEVLFWGATVIGILALILGIVATARRRGRGMGVFAIVLAAIGPLGFFLLFGVLLGVGNGIAFTGSA